MSLPTAARQLVWTLPTVMLYSSLELESTHTCSFSLFMKLRSRSGCSEDVGFTLCNLSALEVFLEPSHLEPLLRHFLSMIRVLILRFVPSDALVLVSSSRSVFSRLLALLLIVFSGLLVLILKGLAIICTITDPRCHVFMRRLLCKFQTSLLVSLQLRVLSHLMHLLQS